MTMKSLFQNLALMAASLFVCFLLFEFVIFKYILKTSDAIPNTSIDNIVRYQPNARATLYEPDGTSHTVKINKQGWNSSHQDYRQQKPANTTRIAVIGDSYVQASAVNVEEGFAEVAEQTLNQTGHNTQVYRFGIDGAPLTQYLYMLRQEALTYNPDIVVIQLIHNDFDESYRFLYGRYSSSFMKLRLDGDAPVEVTPEPYNKGMVDQLKKFRSFRYLYYQTGLAGYVRRLVNLGKDETQDKAAASKTEAPKHGFVQSAIDVRNITELDKIRRVTAYTLNEMKKLASRHGFKLLITMDPVREAIYSGEPATSYEAQALNKIAREEAEKLALPFLDLGTAMTADYKQHGERFEFPWDWHWNKRGNRIAGEAIARKIETLFLSDKAADDTGQQRKAAPEATSEIKPEITPDTTPKAAIETTPEATTLMQQTNDQ